MPKSERRRRSTVVSVISPGSSRTSSSCASTCGSRRSAGPKTTMRASRVEKIGASVGTSPLRVMRQASGSGSRPAWIRRRRRSELGLDPRRGGRRRRWRTRGAAAAISASAIMTRRVSGTARWASFSALVSTLLAFLALAAMVIAYDGLYAPAEGVSGSLNSVSSELVWIVLPAGMWLLGHEVRRRRLSAAATAEAARTAYRTYAPRERVDRRSCLVPV